MPILKSSQLEISAISAYRQSPISAYRQKCHIGTPLVYWGFLTPKVMTQKTHFPSQALSNYNALIWERQTSHTWRRALLFVHSDIFRCRSRQYTCLSAWRLYEDKWVPALWKLYEYTLFGWQFISLKREFVSNVNSWGARFTRKYLYWWSDQAYSPGLCYCITHCYCELVGACLFCQFLLWACLIFDEDPIPMIHAPDWTLRKNVQ